MNKSFFAAAILTTVCSVCFGSVLLVPSGSYPTIQAGIDAAGVGDTVIVSVGTYYENIVFNGTDIILTSTNSADWGVVAGTVIDGGGIGRVVTFSGSETSGCELSGFTIANGSADKGGGIHGNLSTATISRCIVENNDVTVNGGGLIQCDGTVINCIVRGNTAVGNGGGLNNCSGEIINCLVYGNSADYGGGINNCDGAILNCTVADNAATTEGGGLRDCDGTVTNCVVWGNSGGIADQIYNSVDPTYSCVEGGSGGAGNISDDPLFFDASSGNYHLLPGSLCIDGGTNIPAGGLPGTDIEGQVRPVDGDNDAVATADMGVYEELVSVDPAIWVSSSLLQFSDLEGYPTPSGKSFAIRNSGPGTLNWTVSENCSWLSVSPTSGDSTGEADTVTVSVNVMGLTLGNYSYDLTISNPAVINSSRTVTVNLHVGLEVINEEYKLLALDGSFSSNFGKSISIDGNYAIIGAYGDRSNGVNSGSAYIFQRTGTTWTQQAKLIASDVDVHDWFGISVSIDGDYAIVGASANNDHGRYSGSAYIFQRTGTTWTEQVKLTASDAYHDDQFGISVSIDGDYAIVGSAGNDDKGTASGSAYIFFRSGSVWTQQAKIIASDADARDWFGYSVSIDGDYVIASSPYKTDNGLRSGSAYIFHRTDTTWLEQVKLLPSDGSPDDRFGISVSIDGDRVIVGADQYFFNENAPGSAYIYQKTGTTWALQAKLTALDGNLGDSFGSSVSIDGDHAIVGACRDDSNGKDSGSAYIFKKGESGWSNTTGMIKLVPADAYRDDNFGWSVDMSDGLSMIGSVFDDDTGGSSGSAYVFEVLRNTVPVADAGADVMTYAGVSGTAEVLLDGSGSSDVDGDLLTYRWYEGGELIGEGVGLTVELGVGEHLIELVVNDGVEDSEVDSCVVSVVGGIEGDMMVLPRVINRRGRGRYVFVAFTLPAGVGAGDVDGGMRLYPGGVESERVWGTRGDLVFALFSKASVMAANATNGAVVMECELKLNGGAYVVGSSEVVIINQMSRPERGPRGTAVRGRRR